MPFLDKAMIQDANGARPEQFYDTETQEFVLVSEERPYPIRIYPKHSGLIASQGDWGWYTTQVDNEIIIFDQTLNSLFIDSKDAPLKIKVNDCADFWYIDAFASEGIEDIAITKIQIMLPAGVQIKYKGLYI